MICSVSDSKLREHNPRLSMGGRGNRHERRKVKQALSRHRFSSLQALPADMRLSEPRETKPKRMHVRLHAATIDFFEYPEVIRLLLEGHPLPQWMRLRGTNLHHVPPRHPMRRFRTPGRTGSLKHQLAFIVLFRGEKTFDRCIEILKTEWWRAHGLYSVANALHAAYHLIFGNAKDFETCIEILKIDWGHILE